VKIPAAGRLQDSYRLARGRGTWISLPSRVISSGEGPKAEGTRLWRRGLTLVAAIGLAGVITYSAGVGSWSVLAVSAMVSAGAFVAGGLLGFLFGIPQSLTGTEEGEPVAGRAGYRSNTNLEQISDWLTKILVGVGLVQISSLVRETGELVDWLAPGLGGEPSSPVFALSLLVFFTVSGFLLLYVATRITLGPVFARADTLLNYVDERIEAVEQTRREQEEHDVQALALVNRQLDPDPSAPTPSQEELDEAVERASPLVRAQIFARARDQRRRYANASDERGRALHDRTIPVFRALIAADPEERFHRSHAQLGYALKDREPADWRGAETALADAIRIREHAGDGGFLLYEFNRAACRIALNPEARDAILGDVRAAARSPWLRATMLKQDPFLTWLRENGVGEDDLG